MDNERIIATEGKLSVKKEKLFCLIINDIESLSKFNRERMVNAVNNIEWYGFQVPFSLSQPSSFKGLIKETLTEQEKPQKLECQFLPRELQR